MDPPYFLMRDQDRKAETPRAKTQPAITGIMGA